MKDQIVACLDALEIEHQDFSHPPVMTCAEADELCPEMPGIATKNLFLKKGKKYFMVTMASTKHCPMKALSQAIGAKNASFASAQRLDEVLGIKPGAVGLLALLNDKEAKTRVFVDKDLLEADWLRSHPGVNDWTLCVPTAAVPKIMEHTGHSWQSLDLSSLQD